MAHQTSSSFDVVGHGCRHMPMEKKESIGLKNVEGSEAKTSNEQIQLHLEPSRAL